MCQRGRGGQRELEKEKGRGDRERGGGPLESPNKNMWSLKVQLLWELDLGKTRLGELEPPTQF